MSYGLGDGAVINMEMRVGPWADTSCLAELFRRCLVSSREHSKENVTDELGLSQVMICILLVCFVPI